MSMLKKVTLMVLAGMAIAVGGCETVKGVGKDITNASETVQEKL